MDQIAVISGDGSVRILNTDSPKTRYTEVSPQGQHCAWPVWSPDGEKLTYSAYPSAASNGQGSFRVISSYTGKPPTTIYTNEAGTDAIAQHTPHYLMWSPDSSRIAFIAQTMSAGMSLLVADTSGSAPPARILDGAPMFFCWSQDSEHLLVHVRELHYLIEVGEPEPAQVPVATLGYQAPSVNLQDGRIALCGELSSTTQAILVSSIHGGADIVSEVEGSVGFSWRPQKNQLVIASGLDRGNGYYDRLILLDLDTAAERVMLDERVLCFFISPDGSKVAYITPSEGAQGSVRWGILDLETDSVLYLADFRPSREQLTMFLFFDQYSQSHRLWSPDSRKILFSGTLGRLEVRGPLPYGRESSVYIADASGKEDPLLVGQGSVATWSA